MTHVIEANYPMGSSPTSPVVAIIDDDRIYAAALKRGLSDGGVSVQTFDGADAFFAVEDRPAFSLILVDLSMPDRGGFVWDYAGVDAAAAIRRESNDAEEVWILTGQNKPKMRAACLENGARHFLSKDSELSSICEEVLRQVLGDAPTPAAPAGA